MGIKKLQISTIGMGLPLALGWALAGGCPSASAQCMIEATTDVHLSKTLDHGQLVDVDGAIAVVGSVHDDEHGLTAGAAFVFRYDGFEWALETKLLPEDVAPQDSFGSSVSVSGNTIVVGADQHDASGVDAGAVYVFGFDGNQWVQQTKLLPTDLADGDHFGQAVALSGDTLLAGAFTQSGNGTLSGAVYAFTNNGAGWVQEAKIIPADNDAGDLFGVAIRIDGTRAIIGAFGHDNGSAYVYRRALSDWILEATLVPSDSDGDDFGASVNIKGDMAIVGAPNTPGPGDEAGAAYVFRFDGSNWDDGVRLPAADLEPIDRFGTYVAIDGDVALANATEQPYSGPPGPGHVYLFTFNGFDWTQEATFSGGVPEADVSSFGISVVLDGNTALMGANTQNIHSGAVGAALVEFDLGCVPSCPGDVNGDGLVNPLDSGFVLARFGCPVGAGDSSCDMADQNDDGVVDPLDSGFVLARFGECS